MKKALPTGLPDDYALLLNSLKERIQSARLRSALTVNQELVELYWSIGREILLRQGIEGWGTRVIDRLAADQDSDDCRALASARPRQHGT